MPEIDCYLNKQKSVVQPVSQDYPPKSYSRNGVLPANSSTIRSTHREFAKTMDKKQHQIGIAPQQEDILAHMSNTSTYTDTHPKQHKRDTKHNGIGGWSHRTPDKADQ